MAKLVFDWDPTKASKNLVKHRIAFDEAKTVFDDPLFITVVDDEHSTDEPRHITIGISSKNRLLLVAHTDQDDKIRIIHARKATRKEEKFYAEAD